MKKIKRNKKGMELSLNTLVMYIIAVIVLIIVIVFFVKYYGGGNDDMSNIGNSALDGVRNFTK